MKLVCIGDNVVDYYPERKMLYPGGSALNVAVQAERLGLETAYVGFFANDIMGQYLKGTLVQEGVDISHTKVKKGINANSKVKIGTEGKSEILEVDKGVDQEFNLSENDLNYIESFDFLYANIYRNIEEYLPFFETENLKVIFDYSFKASNDEIERTAPWVDLAFFSDRRMIKDYRKFMLSVSDLGPDIVIITLEDKGVLALEDGHSYFQSALNVETVDTLGAGDAFIAGFLSSFAADFSLSLSLKKASEAAAKCCTHYGGIGYGKKID